MNENINLCEILKDCPKGTEFYSKVHGNVRLTNMYDSKYSSPIQIEFCNTHGNYVDDSFKIDGKYKNSNGECLLAPSKDQQDWSKWKCSKPKFDPKTLKAYDKVLVQDDDIWSITFFAFYNEMDKMCICSVLVVMNIVFHTTTIPNTLWEHQTKHLNFTDIGRIEVCLEGFLE